MSIKGLFKNKMNLLSEDKAPTHLEMFKHHKDLEASKWEEVNSLVAQRDEINKQYIQAIKSGDKEVAEELKKKFYDIDSKAVKTAEVAREHNSMATNYHAAAQKSPDYKPDDFDYKPTDKSIEKSESIQKEGLQNAKSTKVENPNQDNIKAKQEPTTDANIKVDQSKQEPSAFDHAKEQTKAPTEFKKAEPVEENPAKPEVSNKVPEKEPSAFENSSAYKNQQAAQKAAEAKAESPKQAEPAKPEAPKQAETKVETTKTAEPNHPNITKPADAQPTQPVQPAPVNPHPSAPGTIAPTSAPQPNHGLNINGTEYGSSLYKPDPSNPWNQFNVGHNGGINTGITTSQPSMIPSSGHFVNNTPQPVSNPVDHWANFKQSSYDAYGHLKNFAGQQYHNIKQSASEHLNNAKQFATDHAHEIAGAGALGAAGLAAYAAYKHFKNKKKQSVSQPH